jgi:hypothetical protein
LISQWGDQNPKTVLPKGLRLEDRKRLNAVMRKDPESMSRKLKERSGKAQKKEVRWIFLPEFSRFPFPGRSEL